VECCGHLAVEDGSTGRIEDEDRSDICVIMILQELCGENG
jgi:hypothetical protein